MRYKSSKDATLRWAIIIGLALVAVLFFLLVLKSCSAREAEEVFNPTQPPPTFKPTPRVINTPEPEDEEPDGVISPLSGLYVDEETANKRTVAIMINNVKEALPQYGISNCEIIYECLAEGGITRLMCVTNSYANVEMIGPVRSARHYYAEMSQNHADAVYIHYGKSPQAQSFMDKNKLKHLDGLSYLDTIMFWRDRDRVKKGLYEHSAFTSGEKIDKGLTAAGYDITTDNFTPSFSFYDKEAFIAGGADAKAVTIDYSYYIKPVFKYDEAAKEYLRFQHGKPHIDALSERQLSFKNIIIIETSINKIKNDTEGRLDIKLTGECYGYYFTNGSYQKIKYKKDSIFKIPVYTDENGKELMINPGKTFIAYVSDLNSVKIEK